MTASEFFGGGAPGGIYLETAQRSGCEADQIGNFVRAGVTLQERQLRASAAARLCDRPGGPTEIGYGGARGGGKSHWLLSQMGADDCQRVPELKCLLLRKVGKANIEHFEDLRRRIFTWLPHEFVGTRGILTFANGSRIIAGHFQNEKDIDAYLGLEYDVIGIEEATTLTARKYQDIASCCRTSKVLRNGRHWRPRIYSTTNPGNIGHAWYKARFILPHQRLQETETRFITARVTDNPFINAEYAGQLARQTGWQHKAWYCGSWDIQAGQFFANFRLETHVVDDFATPQARRWIAALDHGFNHYTVALLAAVDDDGNIVVVDEYAARLTLPGTNAQRILEMFRRHHLEPSDLHRFVAGHDIENRQYDGTYVHEHYQRAGLVMTPAFTNRVEGWAEVLRRIGDPERGVRPTLFIHRRCSRLIECIPTLQTDPSRPEDVLKVDVDEEGIGGDDAADALRYLVATKASVARQFRLRGA